MPVIVIGADTATGRAVAAGLWSPEREVRVFVTDTDEGRTFKQRGFKVAIGDVSDDSHLEAASTDCFTAVLVTEAALDGRERAFAATFDEVMAAWAAAVASAHVRRAIWIIEGRPPETSVEESLAVDPASPSLVSAVVAFDDAQLRR